MSERRQFTHEPARRTAVPLLVSLIGPSGSGKTFSALRIATGIQRVSPGPIFVIDTESRRSTHYADRFDFEIVPFGSPFSPLDYLAAVEHCVKAGAKTIIIDSMSHEHEGPDGVLEWHENIVDKMSRGSNDFKQRAKYAMVAWAKPKAARRRFINTLLQLQVNCVMCFRAKEKLKIVQGREPDKLGWMAQGGEEYNYEAAARFLLKPNCDGVPELRPQLEGERETVKIPACFEDLFNKPEQLNESHGEAMARWAAGEEPAQSAEFVKLLAQIKAANGNDDLTAVGAAIGKAKRQVTPVEFKKLGEAGKKRREKLAAAEPTDDDPEGSLSEHLDPEQDGR